MNFLDGEARVLDALVAYSQLKSGTHMERLRGVLNTRRRVSTRHALSLLNTALNEEHRLLSLVWSALNRVQRVRIEWPQDVTPFFIETDHVDAWPALEWIVEAA